MPAWLKSWFASEPLILWTALVNAATTGTLWVALPQLGLHVPTADDAYILLAINGLNTLIMRGRVTPNGSVPATIANKP